jgi:hypothetical protein
MADTLELPNGDVVGPEDVFLYNNYPYRLVWLDGGEYDFELSPLYWGDSGMDIPFQDRGALVDQWGPNSRGRLDPDEWEQWLAEARVDHRYDDTEIDAIERELPVDGDTPEDSDDESAGLLSGLRDALGL